MNYSTISLDEWKQVGEGGNGTTYINANDSDVLLKVSHFEGTEDAMKTEFFASKAVYELGIPTPEMKQLVKVGEDTGIVCQLIKGKKSFAKLCNENPERIDELARQMAKLTKQLHATDVPAASGLPSMKELMLEALAQTRMLSGKKLQAVTKFVTNLPDSVTLLHGDLQMGNLIAGVQGDKAQSTKEPKCYWIDLGRAAHGTPMFDLGHFYLFCNIFSRTERVQQIAHMTNKQMIQFWKTFAVAYNGEGNMEAFEAECKRYAALDVVLLGHIQTLNWHERLFLGAGQVAFQVRIA